MHKAREATARQANRRGKEPVAVAGETWRHRGRPEDGGARRMFTDQLDCER